MQVQIGGPQGESDCSLMGQATRLLLQGGGTCWQRDQQCEGDARAMDGVGNPGLLLGTCCGTQNERVGIGHPKSTLLSFISKAPLKFGPRTC